MVYLIFGGGGVRGLTYIGAIWALGLILQRAHKHLYTELEGAGGCSIGALMAFMVVSRISPQEMAEVFLEFRSSREFIADSNLMNLFRQKSLSSGKFLRDLVHAVVCKRFRNVKDLTFERLHIETSKSLRILTTNLAQNQTTMFDAERTPHVKVVDVLTASMSVPLIFPPVIINGEAHLDGGTLSNLPMNLFPLDQSIVFYLPQSLSPLDPNCALWTYTLRLFDMIYARQEELVLNQSLVMEHDYLRVVPLPVADVFSFDFRIRWSEMSALILLGRKLMMERACLWVVHDILLTMSMMCPSSGRSDVRPTAKEPTE